MNTITIFNFYHQINALKISCLFSFANENSIMFILKFYELVKKYHFNIFNIIETDVVI